MTLNFDMIRLIAALAVIFSHSFMVLGRQDPAQALGYPHIGTLAVWVFFAVSGYLVTGSWFSSRSVLHFAKKRFARIFPAMIVDLSFAVLVIGPWFTTLQPNVYWTDPKTWDYLLGVTMMPIRYTLPGVFEGNPYPSIVNGSLWSLQGELAVYIAIALLGALKLIEKPWALLLMLAGLFLLMDPRWQAPLALFFVGAMAQLACPSKARQGERKADYSYGLFLYSFPIQQMLVSAGAPIVQPVTFFMASVAATMPLAFVSWHLVEAPALKWGRA